MELWEPFAQEPIGKWTSSKAEFAISALTLSSAGGASAASAAPGSALNNERTIEAHVFAANEHGQSAPLIVELTKFSQPVMLNADDAHDDPQKSGQTPF